MQSVVTLSDRLYSTTALKMGFFYVDVAEQLEREHVIAVAQDNTRTLLQSVLEPAEKTVIQLARELKEEKVALLEESVLRAVIKASTVLGEQERLARDEIDLCRRSIPQHL
jgi:phosphoribosylanthranilate isomerase